MAEPIPGTTFGTYADATGVIDGDAQTEIAALFVTLKGLIPDPDTAPANRGTNVGGNFDQISPILAVQLRHEIDMVSDALSAAPVS
jgi:hypothetical protein|tara:strand:- start:433 stop:690 length:258 start_codon:yes stop_codon:yes gene_type:complete